jgi:uncharacterized membrane protein YkoI
MRRRINRWVVVAFAAVSALVPVTAFADEGEDDHEVARELYEHGDIRPLEDVFAKFKRDNPGDVVGIELVRVVDRWVYRFQVIAADGHRSIIDVDAGSIQPSSQSGDD